MSLMKRLKHREVKDLPSVTQLDAVGSGPSILGTPQLVLHLSNPHLQKEEASQAREESRVSQRPNIILHPPGVDKIWRPGGRGPGFESQLGYSLPVTLA